MQHIPSQTLKCDLDGCFPLLNVFISSILTKLNSSFSYEHLLIILPIAPKFCHPHAHFCWSTASLHWHDLRQNRNILELEIILLHVTWQHAHISRTFYFLVVFDSFQDRNGELSQIPFWYPSTWHDQDWSKHIHFPSKSAYCWTPTRVVRGMGSGKTMRSFALQNFDFSFSNILHMIHPHIKKITGIQDIYASDQLMHYLKQHACNQCFD